MSRVFDESSLQVGDEVGYQRGGIWGINSSCYISTVAKVTKTQITLSDGRKFNKSGKELKSKVEDKPVNRLISAERAKENISKNKRESEVFAMIRSIEKICEDVRRNNYEISLEQESLFFALIANFYPCEDDQQ